MKTKKNYLILAVVAAILCIPALAEAELPRPHEPILLARANPTLAGIRGLNVTIVPPYTDPNEDGLVWKELEQKIVRKLRKADIRSAIMINGKFSIFSYYVPNLRVYVDMLKLPDSQKYVFRIQTSLATKVYLTKDSAWFIEADVWKTGPAMQAVSIQNMPAKVTSVVREQVETFIHAYLAANPPGKQPSDGRTSKTDSLTAAEKQTKPGAKSAVVEYKYVASKNSKVFHIPDCSSAKRILAKNLVGYNSRGEAIQAGKRPCKRCKP